ncbi:MAG: SPOR domain-containing protein [Spirochaetales bacterium]|nr:SPOR domain-containing protein [Spirochaetales bacterium]
MEDKKTLWIIFGIGVCVLVVVAVGFFWFLPEDSSVASAGGNQTAVQSGKAGFDPVEWVRKDETFTGMEEKEEQTDEFVVVSDEFVYGIPEGAYRESEPTQKAEDKVITLDIPERKPSAAVSVVQVQPAAAVQRIRPQQSEPVVKKAVSRTEYWIQAGSFSSLSKATDVKTNLIKIGTASTISTTNVNGTNYYRVRLGPYGEKMEAEKFLNWIKVVEGFESSYVSEVYVTK